MSKDEKGNREIVIKYYHFDSIERRILSKERLLIGREDWVTIGIKKETKNDVFGAYIPVPYSMVDEVIEKLQLLKKAMREKIEYEINHGPTGETVKEGIIGKLARVPFNEERLVSPETYKVVRSTPDLLDRTPEYLVKLVNYARENGCSWLQTCSYDLWLEDGIWKGIEIKCEEYEIKQKWSIASLLFDHDFLKAIWGYKKDEGNEGVSGWKYHAREMVLYENHLRYVVEHHPIFQEKGEEDE